MSAGVMSPTRVHTFHPHISPAKHKLFRAAFGQCSSSSLAFDADPVNSDSGDRAASPVQYCCIPGLKLGDL